MRVGATELLSEIVSLTGPMMPYLAQATAEEEARLKALG